MRKSWAVVGITLLMLGAVWAQERVPQEQAQKYAKLFAELAAKLSDLQIKTDVDADKPFALTSGDLAALVIPDRKLSEDAVGKAGKDLTPVGQLWLRNLSPVVEGKAAPNDKLRIVTVTVGDQSHKLPLCLLGVRKNAEGALELVVYAKDKEPLLKLPLKKAETKQDLPIEVEAKGENNMGTLILNLLGKYQAMLPIARQE